MSDPRPGAAVTDARSTNGSAASSGAPVARVEPAGVEIVVHPGETLFDAAYREGYDWPTICMGQGTCTHCHVRVRDGHGATVPVDSERESRAIRRLAQRLYGNDPDGVRLACHLELCGDVVVEQSVFKGERLDGS